MPFQVSAVRSQVRGARAAGDENDFAHRLALAIDSQPSQRSARGLVTKIAKGI